MLFKIRRIFIADNIFKHASVLHIVSVKDIISSLKISFAFIIQINTSGYTCFPVEIMFQVKIIICSLYNRITDLRIRNMDPADSIRIFLFQFFKIIG